MGVIYMYSKLLDHLIEIVNNSDKLITFSCNTDMEVNYFEKTATRNIIKSDFY